MSLKSALFLIIVYNLFEIFCLGLAFILFDIFEKVLAQEHQKMLRVPLLLSNFKLNPPILTIILNIHAKRLKFLEPLQGRVANFDVLSHKSQFPPSNVQHN